MGLGNRFGATHKLCPLCRNRGRRCHLKESHVILNCPSVSPLHSMLGVSQFKREMIRQGYQHAQEILRQYLGQDGTKGAELCKRGRKMGKIVSRWMELAHN